MTADETRLARLTATYSALFVGGLVLLLYGVDGDGRVVSVVGMVLMLLGRVGEGLCQAASTTASRKVAHTPDPSTRGGDPDD